MCDYSLSNVRSRPAQVGATDHARLWYGDTGISAQCRTRAWRSAFYPNGVVLCRRVRCIATGLLPWRDKVINHQTAIFARSTKQDWPPITMRLNFPTAGWYC